MRTFDPVVSPDAVDAEWLTEALVRAGMLDSGRVVGFERSRCGVGLMAETFRFALEYEPGSVGPNAVVGKFASDDPGTKDFGRQSGYYECEARFYAEVAESLSVAVPRPIHTGLSDDRGDFVLLMDDMAPARTVDQIVGCTVDEAALVVEQAAKLHAGSWRRPDLLEATWLTAAVGVFTGATESFPAVTATFREKLPGLVSDEALREVEQLNELIDPWKRVLATPLCLWHSDFRIDNMLFEAHDGATPVGILDWQGVSMSFGIMDVPYFLGGSMTTEDRRGNERELVRHYHDVLTSSGVEGYAFDACWEDYRVAAIHGIQGGVFGAGTVKRTPRGDEMWRVWIERHSTQTRDLDSFAALRER